ncbi:MAG TPA: acyltransferase [Candidatus Angelobacter sp.]|nr:acyltransferase [Candidatus Angelobacter sp.]
MNTEARTIHVQVSEPVLLPSGRTEFVERLRAKLSLGNIPALDAMRAVAVFLVIFYHFGIARVPGGLGVLIFFVLSGFLITWLLLREMDRTGSISIRGFYLRRALRIFPAFYCFLLGTSLLLTVTGRHVDWPHTISALLYTSNYYQGLFKPTDSFVSHTWSLAIEEQFYLLWPGIFFLFRRNLRKLSILVGGIILFVWVWRWILQLVLHADQSYIYRAFETRVDHLMVGCLLALILRQGMLDGFFQKICRFVWMPLISVALLCLSACVLGQTAEYRDSIGFVIEPLLVAVLLVQLIHFTSTFAWRWLNARPLRWLGRISYSLYLYQQITLHPAHRILGKFPVIVQLVAGVAFTLVMASASFYLVEKYFLKLKQKFASQSEHAWTPPGPSASLLEKAPRAATAGDV